MSFTLFINAVDEPFTEEEVLSAFGAYLSPHPHGGFLVRYDEQNESIVDCDFGADRTADAVSVDRPCSHDLLLDAVFSLLSVRASVLTYPDENHVCIVANEGAASRVREKFGKTHPDFVAALKVLGSADALRGSW